MRSLEPALLGGRRATGRALSGVRTAPYLRKWLILGTLIGVVAGLGAVVFYDGLKLATHLLLTDIGGYVPASTAGEGGFHPASGFARPWAIPLVVGGGGLAAGLLVFGLAPEAEGHGTDAAIKAVHTNPKGVRPRVIAVKLVASAITIGSGGSGGREGPTAQISSGFGSVLARTLNLTPSDSRICVAAGIASGIGAIFRAPFGGALLGVELLYVNDVEIDAFIPSLVATVVGYADRSRCRCPVTGGPPNTSSQGAAFDRRPCCCHVDDSESGQAARLMTLRDFSYARHRHTRHRRIPTHKPDIFVLPADAVAHPGPGCLWRTAPSWLALTHANTTR